MRHFSCSCLSLCWCVAGHRDASLPRWRHHSRHHLRAQVQIGTSLPLLFLDAHRRRSWGVAGQDDDGYGRRRRASFDGQDAVIDLLRRSHWHRQLGDGWRTGPPNQTSSSVGHQATGLVESPLVRINDHVHVRVGVDLPQPKLHWHVYILPGFSLALHGGSQHAAGPAGRRIHAPLWLRVEEDGSPLGHLFPDEETHGGAQLW